MNDLHAEVTVDVRDMLCAQALALVAQAAERLAEGRRITVLYTTEDVKLDVITWARARGFTAEASHSALRLKRERASLR